MYKILMVLVLSISVIRADVVLPNPLIEMGFGKADLLNSGLLGGEFAFTNGGASYVSYNATYSQGVAGNGSYALDLSGTTYWISADIDRDTSSEPFASFNTSDGLSGMKSFTVMFWYKGQRLNNASSHLFSGSGSIWNQVSRQRVDGFGRAFRSLIHNVEYNNQSYGWWNAENEWILCAYSYDFTTNTERTFAQRVSSSSQSVVITPISIAEECLNDIMRGVHFGIGINGLIDNIRVYGSKIDGNGFLTIEQINHIFTQDQLSEIEHQSSSGLPVQHNLKLHLDAQNKESLFAHGGFLRAGSKINVWQDISNNANNFIQGDSWKSPVWIDKITSLNGLAAMQFDGSSSYMSCESLSIGVNHTMFVLLQNAYQKPDYLLPGVGNFSVILSCFDNPFLDNADGFGLVYNYNYEGDAGLVKGAEFTLAQNYNDFLGEFAILAVKIDENGNAQLYRQSADDIKAVSVGGIYKFTVPSQMSVGYYLCNGVVHGARNYRGYIAELIVYENCLSEQAVIDVSNYFYAKYFCRGVDKFGAGVYLDFEKNLVNRGSTGFDKGQFTVANGITPKFGKAQRGFAMDLTLAQMGQSAGCAVFGVEGTENSPIEVFLNGLRSFTACGWFNTQNKGSIKSYTGFFGRIGQLFLRSFDDQSRMVLGVNNQWTTADSDIVFNEQNQWVFWAVSYDGGLSSNNVKWYKGKPTSGVALIKTNSLNAGILNNTNGNLAFGNLLPNGSYAFAGLLDEIRIFGSKTDASGVLSFAAINELFDDGKEKICEINEVYGDFNGDCIVDIQDISQLFWTWGADTNIPIE